VGSNILERKKCRGKKNPAAASAGGRGNGIGARRASGRMGAPVGLPDADRFQHLSAPHWPTYPIGPPDADRFHARLWPHQIRGYSMPAFDLPVGDQRKPATKIRT